MDSPEFYSRRRLQVVADADPGSIARVVERFQNLNIIPQSSEHYKKFLEKFVGQETQIEALGANFLRNPLSARASGARCVANT